MSPLSRCFPWSGQSWRSRPSSGFTLIEVVLAVMVLALLIGGLMGVVRATLVATQVAVEETRPRQQWQAFQALCDRSFASLPPDALFVWQLKTDAGAATPEILLRDAPSAFAWGQQSSFYGEIALATKVQADGTLTLGVERREIDEITGQPREKGQWLPLLTDLDQVNWFFYERRTRNWLPFWNEARERPALILLRVQRSGTKETLSRTFVLPPIARS